MNLTTKLALLFMLSALGGAAAQEAQRVQLYLIPGMGTDHRIFGDYAFDTAVVKVVPVYWADREGARSLREYARVLSAQIDTTAPFVLLGVSMGGMLALEMGRMVGPSAIVLVSSARSAAGLPRKARIGRCFPLHHLLTDRLLDKLAARKWFFREIENERHIQLYQAMLADTGAGFLKWQIDAISRWTFEPERADPPVFQVHGERDQVLPLKKGHRAQVVLPGGTHKIVVNQMDLLARLVEQYIAGR